MASLSPSRSQMPLPSSSTMLNGSPRVLNVHVSMLSAQPVSSWQQGSETTRACPPWPSTRMPLKDTPASVLMSTYWRFAPSSSQRRLYLCG
jgi:hypothetical protein